jgi:hypothetical protein
VKVAWHEVPGNAVTVIPSRRVRCERDLLKALSFDLERT